MGERKLSHELMDFGFFSALGTSEHSGCSKEETHVKRGRPYTHDSNNGVVVVYDEEGRPWIICNPLGFNNILQSYPMERRGAYVPHSNDGGYFVHEVMDKMMIKP
ncbi:MAG: hypothetical protein WC887_00135 [Candidatus Paceibacterota bacterium]|jgi:hypothetical protein